MEKNPELKTFVKTYVDKLFAKVSGSGAIGKKKMCDIAGDVLESDLEPLFKKIELLSTTRPVENEVKKKPRTKENNTVEKSVGSKRRLNWSNIRINKVCGIRAFDTEYYVSVQSEIINGELENIKNSPMSICKEVIGRWKKEESLEGNANRFQDWVQFARSKLGEDAPDSDPTSPSPSSKTATRAVFGSPDKTKQPKIKPEKPKPKAKAKAKAKTKSKSNVIPDPEMDAEAEADSDIVPESDTES